MEFLFLYKKNAEQASLFPTKVDARRMRSAGQTHVIASVTKVERGNPLDCFVALLLAMT